MKSTNWLFRNFAKLKSFVKTLWQAAGASAPCCGIHLDREMRRESPIVSMAGTCCGVRM